MARKIKNRAKGENTIIGAGTVLGGGIVSDATAVRIDGKVNGGVETKGDLIVGPDAEINGNIVAFSLILAGKVTGNVKVTHRVEIEAGGKLIGDIDTELLVVDETAVYQGNVVMRNAVPTDESTAPVEANQESAKEEQISGDNKDE